jgi:hypothetical protein
MKAGDFFRCFDGPNRFQFGKCTKHDDEWLVVEFFKNYDYRRPGVAYPYSLAREHAERFLEVAEVWP